MDSQSKLLVRGSFATAFAIAFLSVAGPASTAFADDDEVDAASFPQVEQKLKKLKRRVKDLETKVGALEALALPVSATVNCGLGQTISSVLAAHAQESGQLTITFTGTCNEGVVIERSNVTLQGQGAATIQGPATGPVYTVIVQDNAAKVALKNFTATGTTGAVAVLKGAHAVASGLTLQQSISGAVALDDGVLDIAGSSIHNNTTGVYSARGGMVGVTNTIVELNTQGVLAWKGGMVNLTSTSADLATAIGPTIRNNANGVVVRAGGFAEFADAIIQNNTANGVVVDSNSVAHFFVTFNGTGTQVTGNTNNGVFVNKTASVVFQDNSTAISGNNIGIQCLNNPAYIVPVGFTVSGNTSAQVLNCTP